MGMGEPMTNFVAVDESVEKLHLEFAIPYRRITVSTSGTNVDKLMDKKYNAALSLHTLDQTKRKKLMPASLSIPKLIKFAKEYCADRKYGLMVEYALIRGENDSDEDLKRILAVDWPANINFNLIEYNSNGDFVASSRLEEFKKAIMARGWKCFIRHSRGADIDAACGMLDVPSKK
jgi:23S rRNA (adenine2503-C2)-methyltransferase